MSSKTWFEVDKKGLKELQEGKPITYLMRELIQNALDEDITQCNIHIEYERGRVQISVEDDSPVGFKDITDSYTLFRTTQKRKDAGARGRFNLGEKQVFAICDTAEIITTTGGVLFDKDGRHSKHKRREKGSIITVSLRMKREEFEECFNYCSDILVPKGIIMNVTCRDGLAEFSTIVEHIEPHKSFEAKLQTELLDESGEFPKIRKMTKSTQVNIHKNHGVSFLYELGLPVCEIDCEFSIDVQQKIPMSADRDKVEQKYLKELYGMVLNNTIDEIKQESSSEMWVREATGSSSIDDKVVDQVIEKRWGDKVAIANPFDPNANDEAISRGYKVINSWEIGGDERDKIKSLGTIFSTSTLFGKTSQPPRYVAPSKEQEKVGEWTKKVAKDMLGIILSVSYVNNPESNTLADYGRDGGNRGSLRFNVGKLGNSYWILENKVVCEKMLDLIIHELGHCRGNHTDHAYHECITMLGAKLTLKALADKIWFKV
ncbi:MAG: ATP-binding protein [Nanoarchaeota archaeon]